MNGNRYQAFVLKVDEKQVTILAAEKGKFFVHLGWVCHIDEVSSVGQVPSEVIERTALVAAERKTAQIPQEQLASPAAMQLVLDLIRQQQPDWTWT